jgi:hypothetical protein
MMRAIAFAVVVLLSTLALPVFAETGSTYDWRSGNWYQWNRGMDGSTNVRGFSATKGTQWNTTIQPNGDMRGTDGRGNLWNYNSHTGTYWNTDGTFCTGRGYARTCN